MLPPPKAKLAEKGGNFLHNPANNNLIGLLIACRFPVIHDRWDRLSFKTERSIEDLKERYYGICEKLETLHADPSKAASKTFFYDADHERRRKEQLKRLYNRTPEQIEEEEMLRAELKKIEARKKEREKKTQDLQKLIMQADSSASKTPSSGIPGFIFVPTVFVQKGK